MKRILFLILAAGMAFPQDASKPDLLKLADELQAAIDARDWKRAAELSGSLNTAVHNARNQALAAEGSKLVDQIITWLPADTETLVVAQQPFPLLELKRGDLPSALDSAQTYLLGQLTAAEGAKLEKALAGKTVRVATLAARAFAQQPAEKNGAIPFGLIAYQGCATYAFAQPVSESDLSSILSRSPDETAMGHRVWKSKGSESDRRDSDTFFVSVPATDMLLVCNDPGFMEEMMNRMAAPGSSRALPANLPEWKLVDRAAPVWAIRHLRADRAGVDPSQPAHLLSQGQDPGATGVVVHFGLPSMAAQALIIAKRDPWAQAQDSPDFHGAAASRRIARDTWELSVSNKLEAGLMAAFLFMAVLGFVVYV